MTAPILHTERLTLRMPILADFEYRAAFYASDRSVWEDGPLPRAQAWRVWASEVAQWPLMGFGPFSLEDRQSRQYLGEVGVYRPEGFPEPELGWFVLPEAEGRGYAAEAARAVMGWVRKSFGWDHLVSYIAPGNLRSIALALRIGGRKVTDRPGTADDDVVILHDLRGIA
ncbi:acetyltransferase [Rhodovulum sp. NI22]|nr:acetyltransferase [Rhodovulum sp. NI22]